MSYFRRVFVCYSIALCPRCLREYWGDFKEALYHFFGGLAVGICFLPVLLYKVFISPLIVARTHRETVDWAHYEKRSLKPIPKS